MDIKNTGQFAVMKTVDGKKVIEGYAVRYTDAAHPDLDDDYFTGKTNFELAPGETKSVPLMFDHGQDKYTKRDVYGTVKYTRDLVGVYAKAVLEIKTPELFSADVLERRKAYQKEIEKLAKAGKLAWSSGAVPQSIQRDSPDKNGVSEITQWVIGEISLTPTPAEWKNGAEIKSIKYITDEENVENKPEEKKTDEKEDVKKTEIGELRDEVKVLSDAVSSLTSDITDIKGKVFPPEEDEEKPDTEEEEKPEEDKEKPKPDTEKKAITLDDFLSSKEKSKKYSLENYLKEQK